jgi:hypothetical protein
LKDRKVSRGVRMLDLSFEEKRNSIAKGVSRERKERGWRHRSLK